MSDRIRPLAVGVCAALLAGCTVSTGGSTGGASLEDRHAAFEAAGRNIREDRIDWLAEQVVPISSAEFGADPLELAAIGSALADARVVGLGEPSHGNGDLVELRARLVRELVENRGFRFFVLEDDAGNVAKLDGWLQTGEGSWASASSDLLVYYKDDGYRKLFEWFADWNRTHPDERVSIWGADTQTWESAASVLVERAPALAELVAPVAELATEFSYLEGRTLPVFGETDGDAVVALYAEAGLDPETISARVDEIRPRYREAVAPLVEAADTSGDPLVVYLANAIRAYGEVSDPLLTYYFNTKDWVAVNAQFGAGAVQAARDRALADNVLAVAELLGGDSKGIYWAHNAHVGRGYLEAGSPASGRLLGEALGDGYVAVLGDFETGSFSAAEETGSEAAGVVVGDEESAAAENPTEALVGPAFTKNGLGRSSLSAKLGRLGHDYLWFDLRGRDRTDPDEVWLFDPMEHYNLGGTHSNDPSIVFVLGESRIQVLPDSFDAVLFSRVTTPLAIDPSVFEADTNGAVPVDYADPEGRFRLVVPAGFAAADAMGELQLFTGGTNGILVGVASSTGPDAKSAALALLGATVPGMENLELEATEDLTDADGSAWVTFSGVYSDGLTLIVAARSTDIGTFVVAGIGASGTAVAGYVADAVTTFTTSP